MPQDTIVVPPLPTPGGGAGEGSAELAADFMKSLAPAAPAAPEPAKEPPQEPPKQPQPPKEPPKQPTPAPKATPEPAKAPAPPAAKDLDPDDPKVDAKALRTELKRVKESVNLTVREKEKQISDLQGRMADFEKRRYWTDEDLKLHEASVKQLAQAQSELYSRDYASSPEYKTKYQDRFDQVWQEASQEVKGMVVRYQDGLDDEQKPIWKERPATERDLLAVIDAPISERISIAKRLFGDDKEAVLQWARDIASIRKEASKAIEEKRTSYASEMTQRNQKFQEANQKLTTFVQQTTNHLAQAYPDIFTAPADQPEAQEALKKGFGFVDESSSRMMEFDINTRAARAAVIRSMAGAFPRLLADRVRDRAEIQSLKETLAKYDKTDPGSLGGGGGGGSPPTKEGGTDEMAAEFDAIMNK